MKPSLYMSEVNNVLKESKVLLTNWTKQSRAKRLHTQHINDCKKARTILTNCKNLHLIASSQDLNVSDGILEKLFKQYEKLNDKALAKLS